jgi:hypothetical protein
LDHVVSIVVRSTSIHLDLPRKRSAESASDPVAAQYAGLNCQLKTLDKVSNP